MFKTLPKSHSGPQFLIFSTYVPGLSTKNGAGTQLILESQQISTVVKQETRNTVSTRNTKECKRTRQNALHITQYTPHIFMLCGLPLMVNFSTLTSR